MRHRSLPGLFAMSYAAPVTNIKFYFILNLRGHPFSPIIYLFFFVSGSTMSYPSQLQESDSVLCAVTAKHKMHGVDWCLVHI